MTTRERPILFGAPMVRDAGAMDLVTDEAMRRAGALAGYSAGQYRTGAVEFAWCAWQGGAMSSREPGISDGAGVAPARFSLLPRGARGMRVDPRQPLTLRARFYADSKRHTFRDKREPTA